MKTHPLLVIGFIFLAGCDETTEIIKQPPPKLIYANSFETSIDTLDWTGQGAWSVYPEGAPGGGSHSLSVWGTDIGPHAEKVILAPTETSQVIFRYSARCLSHPHAFVRLISLAPVAPYPSAGGGLLDTNWKSFADTGTFPPGYNLRIWIEGDGIFATPVLVDKIEVLTILK